MPGARHRFQRIRRILAVGASAGFLVALGLTVWIALRPGVSPLPAAAVLYVSTVAYGLSEMVKLRERRLFGPGAKSEPRGSALLWWLPRILLVLAVAALPAALLLGGLPGP